MCLPLVLNNREEFQMNTYLFYEEIYTGLALSVDLFHPRSKIVSSTLLEAVSTFARKRKINLIEKELIDDKHVRVYFSKKKFLGRVKESVYYIAISD